MIILGLLFILSLNVLFIGFNLLKDIYETLNNDRLVIPKMSGISQEERKEFILIIACIVVSAVFAIIAAVQYYKICIATIEDIITPRHPVENPVIYGISMIIISLIFTGGVVGAISSTDVIIKKYPRIVIITTMILLIIYLILKAQMILP